MYQANMLMQSFSPAFVFAMIFIHQFMYLFVCLCIMAARVEIMKSKHLISGKKIVSCLWVIRLYSWWKTCIQNPDLRYNEKQRYLHIRVEPFCLVRYWNQILSNFCFYLTVAIYFSHLTEPRIPEKCPETLKKLWSNLNSDWFIQVKKSRLWRFSTFASPYYTYKTTICSTNIAGPQVVGKMLIREKIVNWTLFETLIRPRWNCWSDSCWPKKINSKLHKKSGMGKYYPFVGTWHPFVVSKYVCTNCVDFTHMMGTGYPSE
jgi:hypothetical protein